MAKPWVDGSKHSAIYGAIHCQVIKEDIFIKLINKNDVYFAKYKIKYIIHSDVNQTVPLVFIGLGLSEEKLVIVNSNNTQIKKYKSDNTSEIRFSENDSLAVNEDDLIFFEAKVHEGENTIYVEYNADLEYNTQGFIKTYKLNYSLYPSKFWESFGEINIELFLGDNLKITSSNIGQPKNENKTSYWIIKKIKTDTLELEITKKTNIISDLLLIIQPFGISVLFLIIMFVFHRKILIDKYTKKNFKFKSVLFWGIILVPIVYYFIFFLSYSLIDFTLGQENSNHGYVILYIFTLPILMFVYGTIMWLIDRQLKKKYGK